MHFKQAQNISEITKVLPIIQGLDNYYPDFNFWFWNKVVPGIFLGEDKFITMYKKDQLVGVSLIKKGIENKLRALRIVPEFQKTGAGLYLMDHSLKLLDDDHPLCSVSEELLHQYSRIFVERYKFDLTSVQKGIYRKGKLEYEFNGNQHSIKDKSFPY